MDATKTDNIGDLGEGEFVFDDKSEVRTLVNHHVSFVLPLAHGQPLPQPTIFQGRVVFLEFGLGQENRDPKFSGEFAIDGQKYKLPKTWGAIHRRGVEMAKRYSANEGVVVLGAEEVHAPTGLCLDLVHINMGKSGYNTQDWTTLIDAINAATNRKLKVIQVPNSQVLVVPATWILQDLTAIGEGRAKDAKTARPQITIPKYAFPVLGSKIVYTENQEQCTGVVRDFDVVKNGDKVEVLLVDPEDPDNVNFLLYANIYAKSEKELRNPVIISVVTPHDQLKIKEINKESGLPNFVITAQNYIFDRLKGLWIWTVDTDELKVLASEYPSNQGRGKQEKAKTFWVTPQEAIENSNLRVVSFEGGEAYIDGVCWRISHNERKDALSQREHVVDLHDLTEEADVTSLVFNAVLGTAKTMVGNKQIKSFFSTFNGLELSMTSAPLFQMQTPTGRPCVDTKQLQWVVGYQAKGKQKGYEDQLVVYWAQIPEAFKNFYVWVMKRGDPNYKLFQGKTISQVRDMFVCDEFPNLVDAFNFMTAGVSAKNPTRDSAWTNFFISKCLHLERKDLD